MKGIILSMAIILLLVLPAPIHIQAQGEPPSLPQIPAFNIDFKVGWNMISIPVDTGLTNPHDILNDVGYFSIWDWNANGKRYTKPSEMIPGKGYWVLVLEDTNQILIGNPIESYSVELSKGWHMLGSLCSSTSIIANPPNAIYYDAYLWDRDTKDYIAVPIYGEHKTLILPSTGFWLLVLNTCSVTITTNQ